VRTEHLPLLVLVRGAAVAVTQTVEALRDGDFEYAAQLAGIADEYLSLTLERLERRAA
jgi:hypothetical protein